MTKKGKRSDKKRKARRQRPEDKAWQKAYRQRPEVKARNKAYLKKYNKRLDVKARNQTPEVKAKRKAYDNLPETKARAKKLRQTPEAKAKRKAYTQRPEIKARAKKYHKKYGKENEANLKKYRKEYWSSPEVRVRLRKYYAEMDPKKKEEQLKKAREYGSSPKGREIFYKRYHRDPDKHHAWRNKSYERVKREVFSGLSGGEPECAHCKEMEFLFLTIHHVFGRKTAKEKRGVMKSDELYRMIRREFNETGKWSAKYQVLCYCCNMIEEIKRPKDKPDAKYAKERDLRRGYRKKLKLEVFSHYSNGKPKCACCEWDKDIGGLSIDHKDGRKDPKEPEGLSSERLYRYVKKSGYPPTFRVLCLNCNAAIGHHGKCPHEK